MERLQITMSTDGACSGNPGPGGYGIVLRYKEKKKEIGGYAPHTTNNKMEMKAVIEGMRVLLKPSVVTVRTDSQVLCCAIANLDKWAANDWRKKTGARCANVNLLQEMYDLKNNGNHVLLFQHVQGHSGDEDNERCDAIAKEQIRLHARCSHGI